jgi:hypothetical protein
MHVPVTPASEP